MSEFFYGWRRKSGVITLGIACVFVVVWMRSYFVFDQMAFAYGHQQIVLWSTRGYFAVDSFPLSADEPQWREWTSHLESEMTDDRRNEYGVQRKAISERESSSIRDREYWWYVIPLMALSACLLLWPGTRKPKSPPQS